MRAPRGRVAVDLRRRGPALGQGAYGAVGGVAEVCGAEAGVDAGAALVGDVALLAGLGGEERVADGAQEDGGGEALAEDG